MNITVNFPELAKGVVFICSPWPSVKMSTFNRKKMVGLLNIFNAFKVQTFSKAIPSTNIVCRTCQKFRKKFIYIVGRDVFWPDRRTANPNRAVPELSLLHLLRCLMESSALFLQSGLEAFNETLCAVFSPYCSARTCVSSQWKTCIVLSLMTGFWGDAMGVGPWSSLHIDCLIQQRWNKSQ